MYGYVPHQSVIAYCYKNSSAQAFNITCLEPFHSTEMELYGKSKDVAIVHLAGKNISVTCPFESIGHFSVTCRAYKRLPQCTSYNGSAYSKYSRCSVVGYTADSVTCKCDLLHGNTSVLSPLLYTLYGRYSTVTADSEVSDYSITFNEAGFPVKRVASNLILVSAVSLLVLSCLGLLFSLKRDHQVAKEAKRKETFSLLKERTIQSFFEELLPAQFTLKDFYSVVSFRFFNEHSILRFMQHSRGSLASEGHEKDTLTAKWLILIGDYLLCCFTRITYYKNTG
jgi:hypothetical protein